MKWLPAPAFLPLLLAVGLGGCAGPVETHVRSGGAGVRGAAQLMWAPGPDGETPPPMLAGAQKAMEAALRKRGFQFGDAAPVMVAIGVAERPAGIALKGAADEALSRAKRRRLFQDCADRLLRMTVSLTDSASGETLYHGEAQEAHCQAALDEVLPRLAASAVADIAAPGTEHRRFTLARD